MMLKECTNLHAPVLEVKHSELTHYGDTRYTSCCPVCQEGLLTMMRDPITFELLEYDRCLLCAQQVKYLDIEELKKGDWA